MGEVIRKVFFLFCQESMFWYSLDQIKNMLVKGNLLEKIGRVGRDFFFYIFYFIYNYTIINKYIWN